MRPLTAIAWTVALLVSLPGGSSAQVLKELEPVHLEYGIYWGEPMDLVGEATVSFVPVDTKRGRRLEVESTIRYTLPRETPFEYEESCEMTCDEAGAVRFRTEVRAQGQERINIALIVGDHYQVTTTFGGKTTSRTITSGVRRTNFGMFAGAFLPDGLDKDGMFIDYPLLFPVGGDHQPRQKYREGTFAFHLAGGGKVPAIKTRLKRVNETSDHLWNCESGHQILLRMDEASLLGPMSYELVSVNGVSPSESEFVK